MYRVYVHMAFPRSSKALIGGLMQTDFIIGGGPSVFLFTPQNAEALEHLQENVSADAQWLGNGLAVEWRYAADLVAALGSNGFSVS
jgi:hypothetical protein